MLYYFVFSLPDLSVIVKLLCCNRKCNVGKHFDKTFFFPFLLLLLLLLLLLDLTICCVLRFQVSKMYSVYRYR